MKDIVIVPVFHRTDYTRACLESLLGARGIEEKSVWIPQDHQIGCPDLDPVYSVVSDMIWYFKDAKSWRGAPHREKGFLNNTHNALRQAYECGAERVYFVEDDVIVAPDFFEWSEAVHRDGNWVCSSAWRNPRGQDKPFDIEAYYEVTFPTTVSIGTCFSRAGLELALRTHDWNPQNRMLTEKWRCVMPYVPRCYHAGKKSNSGICPSYAVDGVPNPLPDYGGTKVVLR